MHNLDCVNIVELRYSHLRKYLALNNPMKNNLDSSLISMIVYQALHIIKSTKSFETCATYLHSYRKRS